MKNKILLTIIFGMFFISLVSAMPIYLKPLDADGNLQSNTSFSYVFNFTTNSDCSGVVLSNSSTIITGNDGIGFIDLDISSISQIPSYLCEYKDGSLRKTHTLSDELFRDIYARNLNMTGNVSANTGFFSWLGSLANRITKLFVIDIDASGNITADYFFGNINASNIQNNNWIEDGQETSLNVNRSNYWDNLDSPSDIVGSEYWYNHTLETFNLYDDRWLDGNVSFNQSLTDTLYLGIADQRFNETDWVIAQSYLTSFTESDPFAYNGTLAYNSSLSNYYLNSNPNNFLNQIDTDLLYAVLGYGDDWNKTYADTLYYGIGNSLNFINNSQGQSYYLNLSGENANQNINIGNYNFTSSWLKATNLNITGNAYIGQLTWNGNLDLNGNNLILNGGYVSGDGDNEGIFVDSTGRVGIGTGSPERDLDILGNMLISESKTDSTNKLGRIYTNHYNTSEENILGIDIRGLSASNEINYGGGSAAANAVTMHRFYTASNDTTLMGTAKMTINGDGKVGIGTAIPDYKLDVEDTISVFGRIYSTGDANAGVRFKNSGREWISYVEAGTTNYIIRDGTAATDPFEIEDATPSYTLYLQGTTGNVGIGTTSPDYKLQVNGDIVPETNATFDLGTSALAWDNVYAVTYNDLTPAWRISDGSALDAIREIKNKEDKIDHKSYPIKLRTKYYVVEIEGAECGEDTENITGYQQICTEIINETTGENTGEVCEDNLDEPIYGQKCWIVKNKKSVKVDESLSQLDQENYVANRLNITLEEVNGAEIQYTRNLGGAVTMILSAIQELFKWNTEQDERIAKMEATLCSDGHVEYCK